MRIIGALLVAAGMASAGCVAPDEDADNPAESTKEFESNTWCGDNFFRYEYYSDPGYTNLVGVYACQCHGWLNSWGTPTSYVTGWYSFCEPRY